MARGFRQRFARWSALTGLLLGSACFHPVGEPDAGIDQVDAGGDAGIRDDAGLDAGPEDAGTDAGLGDGDAGADAGPDAGPPLDAGSCRVALAAGCPLYDNWFDGTITLEPRSQGLPDPIEGETFSFLISFPTPSWGPNNGNVPGAPCSDYGEASSWEAGSYQVGFAGDQSGYLSPDRWMGGLEAVDACGSIRVVVVGTQGNATFTFSCGDSSIPFDGGLGSDTCANGKATFFSSYHDPQPETITTLSSSMTFEYHAAD